jgi:hypothetical protein
VVVGVRSMWLPDWLPVTGWSACCREWSVLALCRLFRHAEHGADLGP